MSSRKRARACVSTARHRGQPIPKASGAQPSATSPRAPTRSVRGSTCRHVMGWQKGGELSRPASGDKAHHLLLPPPLEAVSTQRALPIEGGATPAGASSRCRFSTNRTFDSGARPPGRRTRSPLPALEVRPPRRLSPGGAWPPPSAGGCAMPAAGDRECRSPGKGEARPGRAARTQEGKSPHLSRAVG